MHKVIKFVYSELDYAFYVSNVLVEKSLVVVLFYKTLVICIQCMPEASQHYFKKDYY